MIGAGFTLRKRAFLLSACVGSVAAVTSCGGGSTGSISASGADKTYLSVQADDADGDPLQYQWRVTAGSVENRNARETVWTLPAGKGIHFAYVAVSDGRGGWVEQQYAVSADKLELEAVPPAPVTRSAPAVVDVAGTTSRLRFTAPNATLFSPPGGGAKQARTVYLPGVQVQVVDDTGAVVFAGTTNLNGDLDLPKLTDGRMYTVMCSDQDGAALRACASLEPGSEAGVLNVTPAATAAQNLRLFGHVALAEGSVCGHENEFFKIRSAATVQLKQADGTVLGRPRTVNRYGDYQLSASVPVRGALKLAVQCEGYSTTLDVPAAPGAAGYVSNAPVELSHAIANAVPRIVKMVANGSDGNVRGRMIQPGQGSGSDSFLGPSHYLTYKGVDTKLSACLYYRALGAVADCDADGNPIQPISFDDWKRSNGFGNGSDVSVKYVNARDLNLVRRMTGTRSASGGLAFYVCNAPGPDGTSQTEIDRVIYDAIDEKNLVACVAMEYTSVTGANGGQPITKFFTFGPDGALLLSVNLDGRGEKYMPGTCVACHGGTTYNGRFPEQARASPDLGSRFLPFDTGNYLFASDPKLQEAAQSEGFYQLNQWVRATELSDTSATSRLIRGWYAAGHTIDKAYVPPEWRAADADPATAGAATFYKGVVAISCRTCHVSLRPQYDWNSKILGRDFDASTHFCGGTANLAVNASMPNALVSSDQLFGRIRNDAALAALATQFLGCNAPRPDPVYAKR